MLILFSSGEVSLVAQPKKTVVAFATYTSQLAQWHENYEKFMHHSMQNLSTREVQGAALLKIHHTTANIMAGVCGDMSDILDTQDRSSPETFLRYLDDFKMIVNLSRTLMNASEQDVVNDQPSLCFSSDLGLVGSLYYTCVKCLDPETRAAAMELLCKSTRREGMWNSITVTRMIQQFWTLEAQHTGPGYYTDNGIVHFAYFGAQTGRLDVISDLRSFRENLFGGDHGRTGQQRSPKS